MASLQKTKQELATVILGMTYGDLMYVARQFSEMCAPDNGARPRPRTAEHFASMLHDWADGLADDE